MVNLTQTPSGGVLSLNADCSAPIGQVTFNVGQSQALVYFRRNTSTANVQVQASATGLTTATQNIQVQPQSASQLQLTLAQSEPTVGQCVSAEARITDSLGNLVSTTTTITIQGLTQIQWFTTNDCSGTPVSGNELVFTSQAQRSFSLRSTQAHLAELIFTPSLSGVTAQVRSLNWKASAPHTLSLQTAANTAAGNCLPLEIRVLDSYGNLSAVNASTLVTLSGAGSGGAFFQDINCQTAGSSFNLSSGQNQRTWYFRSTQVGNRTLQVSATGLVTGQASVEVLTKPAIEWYLAGASTVQANQCLALTLGSRDEHGNWVAVGENTTIQLLGAGSGQFFSGNSCAGGAITQVTLNTGQQTTPISFRSAQAGQYTLQAQNGSLNAANRSVTVQPLAAQTIQVLGLNQITTESCVGYQVQLLDSLSNLAPVSGGRNIQLGGAGTGGAFYSDSSCNSVVGALNFSSTEAQKTVYYKTISTGNKTLTFTDSASSGALTPAQLTVQVQSSGSAGPARLSITGSSNINTNVCSAYVITVLDNRGQITTTPNALTVNLSGAGNGQFYSNNDCSTQLAGSQFDILANQASGTIYYRNPSPQSIVIQASANELQLALHSVNISNAASGGSGNNGSSGTGGSSSSPPSTPVKLGWLGPTQVLSGQCAGPFILRVLDANNNVVSLNESTTITFNTGSVNAQLFTNNTCSSGSVVTQQNVLSGESEREYFLKASQAESVLLQASTASLVSGTLNVEILQTALLALNGGPLGVWQAFFSEGIGAVMDVTITVVNLGMTQANQLQPSGALGSGFSYKGGSFPGAGGSCQLNQSLAPGARCTLVISFQPTSVGNFNSVLSVSYHDGIQTRTANLPITGQGNADLMVKGMTAGGNHSCFRYSDMTVKCFGQNDQGQLGIGNTINIGEVAYTTDWAHTTPFASKAVQIVAGESHTCALDVDGKVFCWGANSSGQLGIGSTTNRGHNTTSLIPNSTAPFYTPVDLGTGRRAVQITAGAFHTCALLDNQSIKCWGNNVYGQLGYEDNVNRGTSSAQMGDNLPTVQLGTGLIPIQVVAGGYHTCAVFTSGAVKCWGMNDYGQLGLGDVANRGHASGTMGNNLPTVNLGGASVQSVALGMYHTCAVVNVPGRITNGIKCWGRNNSGQLGLSHTENRGTSMVHMGNNLPLLAFSTGLNPIKLSLGKTHTCVLMDNGRVFCVGGNGSGQLGIDSTNTMNAASSAIPVFLSNVARAVDLVAGGNHNCALLSDSSVKCWGDNTYGQLALRRGATLAPNWGSSSIRSMQALVESQAATFGYATHVFMDYKQTCAIWRSGDISCWGNRNSSDSSTLGVNPLAGIARNIALGGSTLASQLPLSMGWSLGSNYGHCVGNHTTPSFRCWGPYVYYSAPTNTSSTPESPLTLSFGKVVKKAVFWSNYGGCYLFTDGSAACTGYNYSSYYNLGAWNLNQSSYANPPYYFTPSWLPGRSLRDIALSTHYTGCAIVETPSADAGKVFCWGRNIYGEGGYTSSNTNCEGSSRPVISDSAGRFVTTDGLPAGTHLTGAQKIAMGTYHTCVLLADQTVRCWGYNYGGGVLGVGGVVPSNTRTTQPQQPNITNVVDLVAGQYFTCALRQNGRVWCWGSSSVVSSSTPVEMLLPTGFTATHLYTANVADHICVRGYQNQDPFLQRLYCWGSNDEYQLGRGDTSSFNGQNSSMMGFNLRPISNANPVRVDSNSWDFRAPGTYTFTVPDGVNQIFVQLWGGGGNSGSYYPSGGYYGATGGGGAYVAKVLNVSPGQNYSVTVGAGLANAYLPWGQQAGNSSFGSTIIAQGGVGGNYSNNSLGIGGQGSGGDLMIPGSNGVSTYGDGGSSYLGGFGGLLAANYGSIVSLITGSNGVTFPGAWPGGAGAGNCYQSCGNSGNYRTGSGGADGRVLISAVSEFISSSGNGGSGGADYSTPGVYLYTIPENTYSVRVQLWGAGGGGAGYTAGSYYYYYSGGGGGYVDYVFNSVTPGDTLYIFVGSGGDGGTSSDPDGKHGQQSSVGYRGTTLLAGGGRGGKAHYCSSSCSSLCPSTHCIGGEAQGGYLNVPGGSVTNTFTNGGSAYLGGAGGIFNSSAPGGNGQFPGGGGAVGGNSGGTPRNGGRGGNGRVIVTPL